MTDELALRLGRLATALAADLDGVEGLGFDRAAQHQQKVALITEALEQAARLATVPIPITCDVPGCTVEVAGPVRSSVAVIHSKQHPIPSSLRDHGA